MLKVKEWLKYKGKQFVPVKTTEEGTILIAKRIKDDKEFHIGQIMHIYHDSNKEMIGTIHLQSLNKDYMTANIDLSHKGKEDARLSICHINDIESLLNGWINLGNLKNWPNSVKAYEFV